ncbi:MAG: hypothetical protein AAF960_11185 [Bacteroidota bacterium]
MRPYFDDFIAEAKKRGKIVRPEKGGLIVELGDLNGLRAGVCRPKDHPKVITINRTIWRNTDSFQRKALLFHELGHCVLNRPHLNELLLIKIITENLKFDPPIQLPSYACVILGNR